MSSSIRKIDALWTKNFVLITCINFFIFCGFQMFPAALPPYLKSIGASDSMLGWLVAIANVTTLIIRPFTGTALDKLGRKWVFIAGLSLMCLATVAHFAQTLVLLFAVRAIHGLGWGSANTSSNTVASENIPKSRFGEGMGYFSLSGSLALAIAPAIALSMPINQMIGTASVFVATAMVLAFFLKYQPTPERDPSRPKESPYEKSAIMPGVILFMITSTYGAIVTFVAIFAAQKGINNIGIYFTVYAIVLVLTRPIVGKLLDLRGYGAAVLPGVALIIVSLVILGQASSMPLFLVSAVLFGAGQGAAQTSAQTIAVANVPRHRLGAANATYFTGFDAGVGFGAVLAGFIAGFVGYGNMFMCLSVLPLIAAGLFIYSSAKRKKKLAGA